MGDEPGAGDQNTKRITIRIDHSTVDRLDELIWENQKAEHLDRDDTRSGLIREKIDELIDELEGNLNTSTEPMTPSD